VTWNKQSLRTLQHQFPVHLWESQVERYRKTEIAARRINWILNFVSFFNRLRLTEEDAAFASQVDIEQMDFPVCPDYLALVIYNQMCVELLFARKSINAHMFG